MNEQACAEEKLKGWLDTSKPPIFTFKFFQKIEEQLKEANKTPGGLMQLWDISGQITTDPIPTGERTKVILHSSHEIAFGRSVRPGWHTLKGTLMEYVQDLDDPNERCCDDLIANITPSRNDITTWHNSRWVKDLIKYLEEHAKDMDRVDTVVAFGLGRLKYRELTGGNAKFKHPAINWLQHATCNIIKTFLEIQQGNEIKVLAQDPDYCRRCIETLGGLDAIDAKRSATHLFTSEGYLNKHTFVVSLHPEAPVTQIVFDLTARVGGPSGILCGTFQDDKAEEIIREWPIHDPPSIRAIEYANRARDNGMVLDLDDTDLMAGEFRGQEWTWDVFGNSSIYLKKRLD